MDRRWTGAVLACALVACNAITGVDDLVVSGGDGAHHGGGRAASDAASGTSTVASGHASATVGAGGASSNAASSTEAASSSDAAVSSAAVTSAAVTSASSTASGGGTDPAQVCVDTINMYRATRGLAPYTRWASNEMCVDGEATTDGMMMSAHYAFGHGDSCSSYGQNECPGYGADPLAGGLAQCLAQMWGEKDQPGCAGCDTCDFPYQGCTNCEFNGATTCGHYLNMKSAAFTEVACGFWSGGWYAQNYH